MVGPMARSVRLRRWQKDALDRLAAHDGPDFLAVATPGAGKTTFALSAALQHLSRRHQDRIIVVAPTSHLKVQWSRAAATFGLHLEPSWPSSLGHLPSDMHGVVVTYQQVASRPDALRPHAATSMIILDELHHAGDDRAWGSAVRHAFEPSTNRLALSGTPFRSDTHAIPFVNYVGDEARPNFEYGYADALKDRRVVRPVYFPRINGFMEWTAPDGETNSASFDDALDKQRSAQRLRTALSLEGEWLPTVLAQANDRLREIRLDEPDAAGLVIATDQDHAKGIAALLMDRYRTPAVVVTSDDPSASGRIAAFATGTAPWIVAVRMVSEGVDIPRLRLGVFATTTATELFFRQAVGRFVRHTGGLAGRERAWLFIPDDPRLRHYAHSVAEQRRHSLVRKEREEGETSFEDDIAFDAVPDDDVQEQMSLFQVLSAQVVDEGDTSSVFDSDPSLGPDGGTDGDRDGVDLDGDHGIPVDLPNPPPPGAGRFTVGIPAELKGLPLSEVKQILRSSNAEMARDLARFTGMTHRDVNGQLNRLAGIGRIADATVDQLCKRADQAEKWMASL